MTEKNYGLTKSGTELTKTWPKICARRGGSCCTTKVRRIYTFARLVLKAHVPFSFLIIERNRVV